MNKYFDEDDIRTRLLKHISASISHLTQRDFAAYLGLSLGKTHYCLTELIKKGYVKTTRFKNSRKMAAYSYMLTPQGIEEKSLMQVQFLRRKKSEYERLKQEIAQLTQELDPNNTTQLNRRIAHNTD